MSGAPIAVVGLASLLPGSDDLTGFWQSLVEARDCFSDVPQQHWRIEDYFDPTPRAKDKTYGRRGGFIPAQPFDALAFGLPPSSLPSTDVAQLLSLLIAQRCIADADDGIDARFDRRRTSVILGAAATTQLVAHMSGRIASPMWREGLRRAGLDEPTVDRACQAIADQFVPWQESTFPGLLGNVIAGRIANRFDLGGTNCVLDAACASSLAALAMAINELRGGAADTVLTGGVDALNDVLMFLCFSQTPALSLTGDCRPFSDRADGTMLGEGVGMLALRRLEDAERDGHRIYAVIRGIGSSSDGHAKSVYAPRAEGQAMALRRAYDDAGYSPRTVELVEAHGTGTVAGDAAEFEALTAVFGDAASAETPATQWCALGSVKSQIGHTKAAAGAASLVKTILALHHRTLPPTIKVDRPNPALGLDHSPFYLNVTTRPWFHRAAHPRRASVSSFGFGGSNFHVALEEYRGVAEPPRLDASPARLMLFSADAAAGVLGEMAALPDRIRTAADLAAHARASHTRFRADAAVRLAIVVEHVDELRAACGEATTRLNAAGDSPFGKYCVVRRGQAAARESIAFLFPGQGSQYLEMGRDLAVYCQDAFDAWDQAVDALAGTDGEAAHLGDIVFPRPAFAREERDANAARLQATRWAQPALAAASLAQLALLRRIGLTPSAVAGHSFGELVALHAAGVFDADSLVQLARARGLAIEAAGVMAGNGGEDPGSMIAVAADAATVQRIIDRHGSGRLVVANDNHPRQAVVSGPTESLGRIAPHLAEAALSYQELNVAAAFHSSLVAPAATLFAEDVQRCAVAAPSIPVIANATAQPYPERPSDIRAQLAAHLAQPVRFRESIDALYARGCRMFIEVGAGNVLTGLVGKCLADRAHVAIALDNPGTHGLRSWWRAMGEVAVRGVPLHLDALDAMHGPAPAAAFEPRGPAVVYVAGTNLGKPYPPAPGTPKPRVTKIGTQRTSMTQGPPTPPVLVASSDDRNGRILEAQRLTQQAILESFSMALRSMGGDATLTPAALAAVAAPAALPRATQPIAAAPFAPLALVAPVTLAPPAPVIPVAPLSPVTPAASAATVLSIIADKTGYPIEVLAPDMDLEADLGIDSIKRVEILAAVTQQVPSLNATTVSPASVRRISDLLALLEDLDPDPHQAAAR